MPYGTGDNPMLWGLWFSMLDYPIVPIDEISTKEKERTEKIKKLAIKSAPIKMETKININKIESKQDFIQLLNFELFDYKTHSLNSADLFHLFTF